MTRRLIVNADDLGQCAGINEGIAEAVERGIVTSSSLMVRWPAAEAAASWARSNPAVSIGLHVDLTEWTCTNDEWRPLYEVVRPDDSAAVDDELSRQLGMFVRLVGRTPTHLDAHQHMHRSEPLRTQLLDVGARLGIPVRDLSGHVRYCGDFYGQYGAGHPYPDGTTFEAMLAILDHLPDGVTELGCHPATSNLEDLVSMYRPERAVELAVLTDPRLPGAISTRGIELCAFGD